LSCPACSGWAIAGYRVANLCESRPMESRSTLVGCGLHVGTDDFDL
jgi:hypothetical protein